MRLALVRRRSEKLALQEFHNLRAVVPSVSARRPVMRRSILCNSTNNPFGGTGGSADIGGGNGMRAGKGLLLPVSQAGHHMSRRMPLHSP